MKQTRTGITAQESSSHPRPAAATVADIMRPTPTTVTAANPRQGRGVFFGQPDGRPVGW
jgi:hypothetical protein